MQLCQPNAPLKNVMNILEEDMNLKNRCKGKKMMKERCIVIYFQVLVQRSNSIR